jgi:hypothetical protein
LLEEDLKSHIHLHQEEEEEQKKEKRKKRLITGYSLFLQTKPIRDIYIYIFFLLSFFSPPSKSSPYKVEKEN